ncbi:hypothetical protein, partial [Bacillus smithii]
GAHKKGALRIITGAFGGPIGRKYSDISEFLIEVEIHNDEHKFLSCSWMLFLVFDRIGELEIRIGALG